MAWKKGQSGNRKGKARGIKNSATLLKHALLESVLVKQNGRETETTKLKSIVTRIVHQAMQGDHPSVRLLFRYAGLDCLLRAANDEQQALSSATARAIRRVILGDDFYRPQTQAASDLKNETPLTPADVGLEPRSGGDIQQQPYQVGYGKPPTHTRFQKGHSGNPAGRPRAPRTIRMLILRQLEEEITLTENGHQLELSRMQIVFKQIVNKAALGDARFQALLLQYATSMDVKLRHKRLPANVDAIIRKSLASMDR